VQKGLAAKMDIPEQFSHWFHFFGGVALKLRINGYILSDYSMLAEDVFP
jgi:hypothetical protein